MNIVGIDPGTKPTLCAFYGDLDNVEFLEESDLAFRTVTGGKGRGFKWQVEGPLVLQALAGIQPDWVFLEEVGPDPKWSVAVVSRLIGSFNYLRGLIQGAGYRLTLLTPREWQGIVRMKAGGHVMTRHRALELLPQHADSFRREKDHNRAAAALIATAGRWVVTNDRQLHGLNPRSRLYDIKGALSDA